MQNLTFAFLQHFLDTFKTSINTPERRMPKGRNMNKMASSAKTNSAIE